MSETLLAMAIGPVQEFIAAARRTRDLWFGSHVLSEISKAAAKAVADRIGNNGHQQLIFPSPEDATELEPADNETRLAVANVILARLPDGVCASEVANTARAAAQKRWKEFAEKARGIAGRRVRIDVWQEQVDDVVEFYSAWQPLPSDSAYRETRRQVMRLLGARKACRDFLMSSERDERLPKSSLDGARDTVLQKGTRGSDSLRLAHNEQLDVVGLTKRRAGGLQSFPSVASVAAHSWLQVAAEQASAQFDELKAECDKLSSGGLISRSPSPLFPFDGTAVFLNRHESIAEEAGIAAGERKSRTADLSTIVGHLQRPQSKGGCGLGEASAYLAVLVADGDRMGAGRGVDRRGEAGQTGADDVNT